MFYINIPQYMLYKSFYLKSQEKLKQEKKNNFLPVKQNCAENRSD